MDAELLVKAKAYGFSDQQIANLTGRSEDEVRTERKMAGLVPSYRLVDTCAAEFEAYTPYYYSTYDRGIVAGVAEQHRQQFVFCITHLKHGDLMVHRPVGIWTVAKAILGGQPPVHRKATARMIIGKLNRLKIYYALTNELD